MKNIIFDIGNVLLDFQPEEYLRKYFSESVMSDLMAIIFSSDEWVNLDLGEMSLQEAIDSLTLSHPHYHDELTFVLNNWTHMMSPIKKHVDIVYELKEKGYALYLLSNFPTEAIDIMYKRYTFFHLFDGAVISAKEKLAKPGEEIYQVLIDRYSLKPSDSVFIDDLLSNVKTAQRLGIQEIYLSYHTDLRAELEKINVIEKGNV